MNRRLFLLFLAAFGLAGYLLWLNGGVDWYSANWGQATAEKELTLDTFSSASGQVSTATKVINPLNDLELASLSAMLERPLFNPGRAPRPAPIAPVAQAEAPIAIAEATGPNPADFTLLGISSSSSVRLAAIRLNGTNDVVFVTKGQKVIGWEVLDIGYRDVRIGSKSKSITLGLFVGSVAPAPVAAGTEDQPQPASGVDDEPQNDGN